MFGLLVKIKLTWKIVNFQYDIHVFLATESEFWITIGPSPQDYCKSEKIEKIWRIWNCTKWFLCIFRQWIRYEICLLPQDFFMRAKKTSKTWLQQGLYEKLESSRSGIFLWSCVIWHFSLTSYILIYCYRCIQIID